MTVTKVEACSKTRFKVYLDGKFAFVLYKGELSGFGISEGKDISDGSIEKIKRDVVFKRAKLRAMHLLEDMDRTEAALREKLRMGFYPPDAVDAAVEYVKSFGYLNDSRYAQNFVRSRKALKSRKEITAALLAKGLSSDQITEAFDICFRDDKYEEEDTIRGILRKKRFDPDTADENMVRKMYAYLARRGFRYDSIRQVIQKGNMDA